MRDQPWAASLVRDQANGDDVRAIIDTLNGLITMRSITAASVAAALTSMLGQTIRKSGTEIGPDIRDGIFALIDSHSVPPGVERVHG